MGNLPLGLRDQSPVEVVADLLTGLGTVMVYACGTSTAVSLPAATAMLLYLMLRPAASDVCLAQGVRRDGRE